jgi:hypothetical protein
MKHILIDERPTFIYESIDERTKQKVSGDLNNVNFRYCYK